MQPAVSVAVSTTTERRQVVTRRELLKVGAGAAAIAVGGAGLVGASAKAATPARLEGIWPYCVWWRLSQSRVSRTPYSWLYATCRGIPYEVFARFLDEHGREQAIALPYPPGDAVMVWGKRRHWSFSSGSGRPLGTFAVYIRYACSVVSIVGVRRSVKVDVATGKVEFE